MQSPAPVPTKFIDLSQRCSTPLQRHLYGLAGPFVESSLAISKFNECYASAGLHFRSSAEEMGIKKWFGSCLEAFGLQYHANMESLAKIPRTGPVIIVANHPFGLADAVILGHMIGLIRPDAKFIANSMLASMPEVKPWIIPVDNFGGTGSERRNISAMKLSLRHLAAGGALIIFPAGEVASYQLGHGIMERPWKSHLGALVHHSKASVVPVHFAGRNSLLFQMAGLLHPRVRTSLLLRELCHRRGKPVALRIGEPLSYNKLKRFPTPADLTGHLRLLTLALGHQSSATANIDPPAEAITTDEPDLQLAGEFTKLRANGRLMAEQGNLSVYMAEAADIPYALQEIGRLREITFRAVGEGTGQDVDLDSFDQHYLHLILWDESAAKIAGGYRVGRADKIMQKLGRQGLYTDTLFRFSPRFLSKMDCALELGRSFVCQEYQRHPASLLLLWKGFSTWVRRHPRYKLLFGPVSISDEYDPISRRLMVDFLMSRGQTAELRDLVRPRSPFRSRISPQLQRELNGAPLRSEEDLSSLVSTIERDCKGLPVLLKHYLKLSASLLCFNVDRAFSSVVDGLILVDLTKTNPKVLARYMGEEGTRAYLDHHGIWPQAETTISEL
jgi:putative hemolysin